MAEIKLIEEYIKERGLEKIIEENKLNVKIYHDQNIIMINHKRYKTKQNEITIQCRGVILHKKNEDYEVICRPFDKFYNVYEKASQFFDYTQGVDVYEKADGSFIKIYYHDNAFNIATNRTAFAEGPCNNIHTQFRSYNEFVLSTFGCENMAEFQIFMKNQDKNLTYMFELISPNNKIITQYEKSELIFLAARNTKTGVYVNINAFPNTRKPMKYNKNGKLFTQDDCKKLFCNLRNDEEGFVLINKSGLRQKLKNPLYLEKIRQNKKVLKKPHKIKSDSNIELVTAVVQGREADFDCDISTTAKVLSNSVIDYAEKIDVDFFDLNDEEKTVIVWGVLIKLWYSD